MPKQLVKVYIIQAMAEIDVEAETPEEARNKVAEQLKDTNYKSGLQFKKPDRNHLIVTPTKE